MADEQKTYLINIESNLDKYILQAAEAKKKFDEMKRSVDELKAAKKTEGVEWEVANAKLRDAQKEYNEAKKLVDLQTQANNSNAESRKQLNAIYELEKRRLGELADQYTINDKGQRVLSQAYLDGVKKVKDAKDAIIAYDKAQSDGRSSVGLYSEAIEGALGKFQALPGPIGSAVGAVKSFGTAMKALMLNPVTLAITAVIGAITGLIGIFKKFDPIVDRVQKLVSGLKAVFSGLKESVIGVITGQQTLGEAFRDLGDNIRTAYNEGVKLKALQQELDDMNWLLIESEAKKRRQIDELLLQSKDRTKSEKERIELIEKALDLEEELYEERKAVKDRERQIAEQAIIAQHNLTDEEIAMLKEVGVAYAIKLKDTKSVTDEEVLNLANAIAAQEKVLNESVSIREKAINRANVLLEKSEQEREKILEKEKAAEQKVLDEIAKLREEHDKFLAERRKEKEQAYLDEFARLEEKENERLDLEAQRLEAELINEENRLAILEQNNAYEFDIHRKRLEMEHQAELDNAEQTGADVALINQKYADAQIELTKLENQSKLSIYGQFAGNIAQIFGKQTAVGKAAAVAQATIETYLSATKAFSSLANIPVVGPVLGAVAAAAAVAAGIANVKKILAVKSGLPGDTGGGGSAPTAVVASAPAQRTFAQSVGSTTLTQPQLTQQQINALPNQNALTAEDIAAAVSKLPKPVVTVEDINARQESSRKVEVRANI